MKVEYTPNAIKNYRASQIVDGIMTSWGMIKMRVEKYGDTRMEAIKGLLDKEQEEVFEDDMKADGDEAQAKELLDLEEEF